MRNAVHYQGKIRNLEERCPLLGKDKDFRGSLEEILPGKDKDFLQGKLRIFGKNIQYTPMAQDVVTW